MIPAFPAAGTIPGAAEASADAFTSTALRRGERQERAIKGGPWSVNEAVARGRPCPVPPTSVTRSPEEGPSLLVVSACVVATCSAFWIAVYFAASSLAG